MSTKTVAQLMGEMEQTYLGWVASDCPAFMEVMPILVEYRELLTANGLPVPHWLCD